MLKPRCLAVEVDNALVGLVRHNPIDLVGGVTGFFDNVICNFCQHFDSKFEYAGTVHMLMWGEPQIWPLAICPWTFKGWGSCRRL